jgi:hypothetical protein
MPYSIKQLTLILFIVCLIIPQIANSQAIPLNKLELKVEPIHQKDNKDVLTPKTIRVVKTKHALRLFWYTLVKQEDEEAYYKTFKVKASKGIVETDKLEGKRAFFMPTMWGGGYIKTETVLPLWIDPVFLDLKGSKQLPFNVGFLNINKYLLKATPNDVFEKLNYFQNLYNQYVVGYELREDIRVSKTNEKALKKFVKDFFVVGVIAKSKAKLRANKIVESYPVLIIGNRYFNLTVINDPLNPLVLQFKLFHDKVPQLFKEQFKELKEMFEFRVTEVTY